MARVVFVMNALRVAVMAALVGMACALPPGFCNFTTAGNASFNFLNIAPATYSAPMAGVSGLQNVTLDMGWCHGVVNSTTCNVSDAQATITSTSAALPACVVAFSTFLGPVKVNATAGIANFQMWSASTTDIASITITCDPSGTPGTAALVGVVTNSPIYSFAAAFTSVHACATQP